LFWVRIDYVINFHGKLIITQRKTLSSLQNSWSFFFMRDYSFFTAPFALQSKFSICVNGILTDNSINVSYATHEKVP
ncbi:MAG: hypothetical protein MR427_04105, partial [Roseburia sp.]|nr:hypothetical protein [Roseburia sp.]